MLLSRKCTSVKCFIVIILCPTFFSVLHLSSRMFYAETKNNKIILKDRDIEREKVESR